mmetsp:Transcript_21562/g.43238  ORF Transcript_21562/g.43238 Transcript_21562/m.43238 type:complete len:213 (+) Transcript_21562:2115-2753(+)
MTRGSVAGGAAKATESCRTSLTGSTSRMIPSSTPCRNAAAPSYLVFQVGKAAPTGGSAVANSSASLPESPCSLPSPEFLLRSEKVSSTAACSSSRLPRPTTATLMFSAWYLSFQKRTRSGRGSFAPFRVSVSALPHPIFRKGCIGLLVVFISWNCLQLSSPRPMLYSLSTAFTSLPMADGSKEGSTKNREKRRSAPDRASPRSSPGGGVTWK